MPLLGRIVMGCLALFVAWTLARAWRSGTVFSEGIAYTIDDHPMLFVLGLIAHFGIVLFCVALATGYTPHDVLAQLGLAALVSQH